MLPNFAALPPEVNSARLHAGAGPAPLLAAATAWDGLATEIDCAAVSFESTIAGLATGSWLGPAALQMTAVAAPYLSWLRHAAVHARAAAALARTAAAEFETALSAAVHPALVAMNRSEALWLAASNLFGQNAPAIAAAESRYADMWAQDVTAMTAYHTGIDAICAELAPWHQRLQTLLGAATARGSATGTPGGGAAAAQTIAEVMGASGIPTPSPRYVQRAFDLFVRNMAPDAVPRSLFTPEGLYPVVGVKSLTFDASVAQGVKILDTAIRAHLAAGDNVSVFGYSQSATVAALEMRKLAASVNPPAPEQLSFTLIGDPGNPNGGLAARFPGIAIPSLGVTSPGATPDNLYPTRVYTIEYDGVADFPRYPLNIVSTLNALAGMGYLHQNYLILTPEQIDAAIPLTNTVGPTMTQYYIIPTKNLPLLEPLRALPVLGNPLADLIQPDLRVIVDLGYGDPNHGYSTSPPNVPTPFGVFPDVDPVAVSHALVAGTQQGISDFGYSITHLEFPALDASGVLTGATPSGPAVNPAVTIDGIIVGIQRANSAVSEAVSAAAGAGYQTLLPTADLANAMVTTAPAYTINLSLQGIREFLHGQPMGLVNAIGYPLAAGVTLCTMAVALEILVVAAAAQQIGAELSVA
ncbi:MAG: PPE family protein [Mycobacterium sp.]|nr:MAG: PPE family protein [Mycobacterium sp.]